MSKTQAKGLRRLIRAGVYSWQGIRQAWHSEAAFREEIMAAAILIPLACWLDIGVLERIMLVGSVVLVIIVELLNSAVEAAIDRIGSEQHPLSGHAKDMGSAAVLFTLLLALFCWLQILWLHWRQ